MKKIIFGITLVLIFATGQIFAGEHIVNRSPKTVFASDGKALFPVIISTNATPEVRLAAEYMARYLSKISGGNFEIKTGDGTTGIAIGSVNDFPEIQFKPHFEVLDPGGRQGYEIKSHSNGIYVIGATPMAVDYAVFDLLQRMGYRMYFPMEKWEIVPSKEQLELAVHIRETPDYYTRRIWPGFGIWGEFQDSTKQWNRVNRAGGYQMNSGHAYGAFVMRNIETFKKHPEYYGLLNGERTSDKLCISNPDLRKLVCDYAIGLFEKDTKLDSVSVDPSDGGGWCECPECAKLGSPSDRALFLANEVSKAVNERFSDKKVGMYAYNQHSPSPSIDADPNVVVNVATSFNKVPVDEMIEGWSARKATLGIREYYDCYLWSYNVFGKAAGGNIDGLKKSIPSFYEKSARYMSAESSDDWGPSGLGYYLAQQMLWNVNNSQKIDSLTEDFLQNCFGPAASTMKEFYKIMDGSNKAKLCPDTLGRMYAYLAKARTEIAGNLDMLARLEDLAIYTRYCEVLMPYYQAITNESRSEVIEKVLHFVARSKNTRMVTSYAIYRDRDRLLGRKSEDAQPAYWEISNPFSSEEINQFVVDGIANNKLLDFAVQSFSNDLVPVASFQKIFEDNKNPDFGRRSTVSFYSWADKNLNPIEISIKAGGIENTRNKSLYVLTQLYKIGGTSKTGSRETLIQTDESVLIDYKDHVLSLTPEQPGLHKIVLNDQRSVSQYRGMEGTMFTLMQPADIRIDKVYFYVPKDTNVLGFFCSMAHRGSIIAPNGERIYSFTKTVGHDSIPVPDGMDGKLWQLVQFAGDVTFLTVPPYVASTPAQLLLPKEVVEKDAL